MWLTLKWMLVGWTLLAVGWRCFSFWLVHGRVMAESQRPNPPSPDRDRPDAFVTIFKPLTALRKAEPSPDLVGALESFVSQLDDGAELLLGVERQDAGAWQPVFDGWSRKHPRARFETICLPRPLTFLNPKVSWLHELASRARGEFWLWSDADIVASPGLLARLRCELARPGVELVTCLYRVPSPQRFPMLLETLYVNVEFLPGVLACQRFDAIRFAFGSGMFFRAATFRERVRWEELGERMADDNLLGRRLASVQLSDVMVETLPAGERRRDALLHYLRCQKTVRWCEPAGFAGLILITPVLGWLAALALQPGWGPGWLGLLATIALETIAAWLICRRLCCAVPARWTWAVAGWSLLRAPVWVICWLPWPVVYRSQRRLWWSLYRSQPYGGVS
jgi:ceramide glucosyltransferase